MYEQMLYFFHSFPLPKPPGHYFTGKYKNKQNKNKTKKLKKKEQNKQKTKNWSICNTCILKRNKNCTQQDLDVIQTQSTPPPPYVS